MTAASAVWQRASGETPHRARYLALSHELPRKLLAVHREWAQEVIDALERSADKPNAKPERRPTAR